MLKGIFLLCVIWVLLMIRFLLFMKLLWLKKLKFSLMNSMKKLICLSTEEALLIQSALTDHSVKISCILSHSDDYPSNVIEQVLDDLDICDSIRKKLSKIFLDLSI